MSEPKQQLNRRQTDSDGNDALDAIHAAHRAIAQHAYHLYMEGGCDRSRVAEYWLLAAQAWLDSSDDGVESPAVAARKRSRPLDDMGIDGRIYPVAAVPLQMGKTTGQLQFMDVWYPVQVKQKDKAGRPDIDAFEAMMTRTDRAKGFYVSFDQTSDAIIEIDAFFRKSGKIIIPLTVGEILNERSRESWLNAPTRLPR